MVSSILPKRTEKWKQIDLWVLRSFFLNFRLFFGRIDDPINCFWDYLTFDSHILVFSRICLSNYKDTVKFKNLLIKLKYNECLCIGVSDIWKCFGSPNPDLTPQLITKVVDEMNTPKSKALLHKPFRGQESRI